MARWWRRGAPVVMYDNDAGGRTVQLAAGDNLAAVPRSHRVLLTPAIRDVFGDAPGYFARLADRCPFPRMTEWVRAVVARGQWTLALDVGAARGHRQAGFRWAADGLRGATVGLPGGEHPAGLPPALNHLYELVGFVDWMGFGASGRIGSASETVRLSAFQLDYHGADVDPETAFQWGMGASGSFLVGTPDGRGGWVALGTHEVRLIGSLPATIDWVFGELLAGRGPDFESV